MRRRFGLAAALTLAWPLMAAAAPTLNPDWGTVFPADRAALLARQCSRTMPAPVTGTWAPTAAQIAALESGLAQMLADHLAVRSDVRLSAADYYRQYGGLVVGGRRIIYVNGFFRSLIDDEVRAHRMPSDWHKVPALICDGGTLGFGVEYDPATGAFANFAFNGSV